MFASLASRACVYSGTGNGTVRPSKKPPSPYLGLTVTPNTPSPYPGAATLEGWETRYPNSLFRARIQIPTESLACLSPPLNHPATTLSIAHHPRLLAEICSSLICSFRYLITIPPCEAVYFWKMTFLLGLLGLKRAPILWTLSSLRAHQSCILLHLAPPACPP